MRDFQILFEVLIQGSHDERKVLALQRYFQHANRKDIQWALWLLLGNTPKRLIQPNILLNEIYKAEEYPAWLIDRSIEESPDASETIALLYQGHQTGEISLHRLLENITNWQDLEQQQLIPEITKTWDNLNIDQRIIFNQLVGGRFNLKLSIKLIAEALSKTFDLEFKTLMQLLSEPWNPQVNDLDELLEKCKQSTAQVQPISFMRDAKVKIESISEISLDHWFVEHKWSGIRVQWVFTGKETQIWTSHDELVTLKFPELMVQSGQQIPSMILEGIIMPYSDEKHLNKSQLISRIKRKKVTPKLQADIPVVLVATDLLLLNELTLTDQPQSKRREMLETLFADDILPKAISLSDLLEVEEIDDLSQLRNESRKLMSSGLLFKNKSAPYGPGKTADWKRWPADPFETKAVLIYISQAGGFSMQSSTEFTFAVKQGDTIVPFTKIIANLSEDEEKEIAQFAKENTLERFGPVRSVLASLVFTVSFTHIEKSTRHKSGIVVANPEIVRWEKDMSVEDINSMEDLFAFFDAYH